MRKICIVFTIFVMYFLTACGNGTTKMTHEQNDDTKAETNDSEIQNEEVSDSSDSKDDSVGNPDNDNSARQQGELYGECYPNKTCNDGLICDKDYNVCIKDSESSENNDDDSDNSDSAPDNDTDSDSGYSTPDEDVDIDTDSGDPCNSNSCTDFENQGYTVKFDIIDIEMMGQGQSMAIGYFMKSAREDLEEDEAEDVTLDTCVMGESSPRVPKCSSNEDCAPEQECVPEYDNNSGQPIENSEHCETPNRASIDVGSVMISGFNGGPYQFAYEPEDQVYKLNGTGDGSIDRSLISYGTEYTISANELIPDDLNSLSATFRMPPALTLIEPVVTEGGTFGSLVVIDNTKPLTFKWQGNGGNGYIDITITAAQSLTDTVSVTCKVIDDGEFTVPEEFASQLVFGGGGDGMMDQMLSMMNMITMDRHAEAPITGEGISSGKVTAEQLIMVNITLAGSTGN